ncbi:MAG: type I glutamate--ammonia ligase [SAR202 cluster bacterium]|nr:type I glutamate--ammonia ligase [SAR202 cluster bacterium]
MSPANTGNEAIEYVLHAAQEQDVKFIRLWFTDILGALKGFAITIDELEHVLRHGATFDGASIEGFARSDEADMVAMPDTTTFQVLPWRPRENAVARVFCDILGPEGQPAQFDSREVLRRNLKRASELGFTFYVGPEIEYFYFKSRDRNGQGPEPLDEGDYFDQSSVGSGPDLRRETVLALEEIGIPVQHSHHEVAAGQHEIDLRHTNALAMADAIVTFRLTVKEIAAQRGVYASFMPRPLANRHGSGMHTHLSLFRGEENAFFDPADKMNLSVAGRRFLAGLIRHAAEITVVTNQWVNSYKRLVPGYEAPVFASWTQGSWGDLVRVPAYRAGRESSVRIEYRAPDPACNPYLAFSVMLAAGLAGIEHQYPLPEPIKRDIYRMSDADLAEVGVSRLPSNLAQAIELAERSDLVRNALGERVFDSFLRNKRIEWGQYERAVTDYEIAEYLGKL